MPLSVDFSKLDAMDMLDMAIVVEDEAEDHYHQLVTFLATKAEPAAIQFFQQMAGREARHREQLRAKRQDLFGDTPPRHADFAVWDVEAPDWDAVGPTMTLRQALELSLAMETQAHDYYAEAKEYAHDDRVEDLLEGLRLAEVEHQRLIQAELDKLS